MVNVGVVSVESPSATFHMQPIEHEALDCPKTNAQPSAVSAVIVPDDLSTVIQQISRRPATGVNPSIAVWVVEDPEFSVNWPACVRVHVIR